MITRCCPQIPVLQDSLCDLGQALQHPCAPNPTMKGEQWHCTSTSKYYGDKYSNDYEAFRQDNMTYQKANSIAINQYYNWFQNQILFLIFVLQHYLGCQPGNILPRITHVSQRNCMKAATLKVSQVPIFIMEYFISLHF